MTDDLPGAWKQVEKLLAERGGSEAHNTAFELMKDLWEIYEEQKSQRPLARRSRR